MSLERTQTFIGHCLKDCFQMVNCHYNFEVLLLCVGVKATYLLAVVFLETLRLTHCGGLLNKKTEGGMRSALICLFAYLETPSPNPAVYQCLVAIVYRAFGAALTWLVKYGSNMPLPMFYIELNQIRRHGLYICLYLRLRKIYSLVQFFGKPFQGIISLSLSCYISSCFMHFIICILVWPHFVY